MNDNDPPVRLGIAGCGRIAEVAHLLGLSRIKGVRIVALMDTDPAKVRRLRELAPGARVFTDYDAFLDDGLDAVSICTPNHLHSPMAVKALHRGLHVLCEKPIAGTLEEASGMIAAAHDAGRILHINHSLRYHPHYATVAQLVHQGAIGTVQHVRCIRAGGSLPNESWSPGADWFVSRAAQGGLLLDIGIHMVDLMRWIAGEVRQVAGSLHRRSARIEVPDNVCALLQFEAGCTGSLELSWTFPVGAGLLEVYGSAGRIRLGAADAPQQTPVELVTLRHGEETTTYPPLVTRIPDSYECFIRAVTGRSPSPTPGELGRDALAICLAIERSHQSGRFAEVTSGAISGVESGVTSGVESRTESACQSV